LNWPDSPTGGLLGDGRHAWSTDRPGSVEDLRGVVTRRVAEGHALYPQGGRTSLDYGGVPRAPGVAVDLTALDRVIDYPAADMTITVQAGMTLSALRSVLAENHQRLPLDAPHPDRATLGGIYATNASGPRRFGAGRPRDQIIGVSFVTSDGNVIKGGGRVVKNVAGYDFPKLLTGSMGTLGVIAQMTLKVRPSPEASALAVVPFSEPREIAPFLDRFNTSGTRPIAIELLNRAAAGLLGQPGLPDAAWLLAVGYEDNAESVAWQLDRLKGEAGRADLAVFSGEEAVPLWSALADLPAAGAGPVSFVANLRASSAVRFALDLDSERWAVQVHAGNGIVRAHGRGDRPQEDWSREVARLRVEAIRDGGNLTLSRCPTEWKDRLRVWGHPRGDWPLMERVKAALDPARVMNPGRFVGTI
jgi:glycolate oxidase FAD binding subunit